MVFSKYPIARLLGKSCASTCRYGCGLLFARNIKWIEYASIKRHMASFYLLHPRNLSNSEHPHLGMPAHIQFIVYNERRKLRCTMCFDRACIYPAHAWQMLVDAQLKDVWLVNATEAFNIRRQKGQLKLRYLYPRIFNNLTQLSVLIS